MRAELEKQYVLEIESRIKLNNFQTLHYVLFDESKRLPWATHLFYKNGVFQVNSRDERSYVVGETWIFNNFDDAVKKFIEILKDTVEAENLANLLGFSNPYSSPLWDK